MASSDRILLILDIDETLLFATEHRLEREPDCIIGPYYAYRRPFLDEFLSRCQQHFDLAVWSSSSADYVAAIIRDALPADVRLEFAWSRDRCVQRFDPEWQSSYFVKDLKKVKRLGYVLDRILIIDDTRAKVERNFGNAIYVAPYDGSSNDVELKYLASYLESLKSATNVRLIEKRGWKNRQEASRVADAPN